MSLTEAQLPYPDYDFAPHWFEHGGVRQHYLDEGTGAPLLMLHGNPTWSYMWRNLVRDLRSDHRCIVPDHIGMGRSDRPDESAYSYTAPSRLADLERLVEHLVTERGLPDRGWTLIGHDWGGIIGMAWARRRPDWLARIVMLNSAAFPMPLGYRLPWYLRLIRSGGSTSARLVHRTNAFAVAASHLGVASALPRPVRRAYVGPYRGLHRRLAVLRFIQDIPLTAADPAWPLIDVGPAEAPQLTSLPMLVCWGGRDRVFDHRFLAEWLRRFPSAEAHLFPRAGHFVQEDAREEVVACVREFLGRHTEGTGASW
ncbi:MULTISPECIES: alpha/beta fold hydrolase [unclassified Streptomyces]|uniref:alpha/beta fold hydrolase n=1 Tax=unclassified Streptomyces TaxID=2593676 RepID=UPI0022561B7F|nr:MULTISPECIES: alpha/beta fold hydrolase [unclassified Streptomyces]MCX5063319.1 alpha/beta fold hydrolase [Streptomyces sp. NBC_00452]MCX5251159.1 alpha/beta fold hydrolase [Streptomyces sp. NBC_00201]MCX5290912.1 alpha/beta fold hydrolase [Streptomyces sp. NBC_00183]